MPTIVSVLSSDRSTGDQGLLPVDTLSLFVDTLGSNIMIDNVLSAGSRSNLLALRETSRLQDQAQESSGDGPTGVVGC